MDSFEGKALGRKREGEWGALSAVLRNRQFYCRAHVATALMLGAGSSDLSSSKGRALREGSGTGRRR